MHENYFDLFQLPLDLPIDLAKLSYQYQQLQKQYHPDNFATVSDHEKALAMQRSATINAAYQTLKNPIKAIEYRVSLAGFNIDEEHHTINDKPFLFEQFELREKLDEIEQTQNWHQLDCFYSEILLRKKQVYEQLLLNVKQLDWQTSKEQLYKLRYFVRLCEHIEQLQEKQFDL